MGCIVLKAEIKPNYDVKRQMLSDVVPLRTPYSFYIEPTRTCNLKCFYCMHSTRGQENNEFQKQGFEIKHMTMEQFNKIFNDIIDFPETIKRIAFSGIGEPLMNRNIPKMVKIMRDSGKVDRIDILTNALLMDNQYAKELIDAGVSKIQVSIQGMSEEAYLENCEVKMSYDKLVSQLKYFYENKKDNQELYIKIIDATLKNEDEKQQFHTIFGQICDNIFVEHLVSLEQQMDNLKGMADDTKNLYNEDAADKKICTVPFYFVSINVDGDVFHCSPPGLPKSISYGNAYNESIVDIWTNNKKMAFLKLQLTKGIKNIPWCSKCICHKNVPNTPEENLDGFENEILERLEKNGF